MYRRYQALVESSATSMAFALLVTLVLKNLNVYPEKWVVVIGVTMGLIGIRWPIVSYIIGVVTLAYPIYTINFYLVVLFIAVSALGQRLFVHFLGATTLVLATPLLAEYHLHWLVPVLGGLWWGGFAGAWIGAAAAVWGKLFAGMAGLNTDWLFLAGQSGGAEAIAARFAGANSLDTLLLLIEPFTISSTLILYDLLQVAGWAIAGSFVGTLSTQKWVRYRAPWSVMVVTAGGGLILIATHLGLPYWLDDAIKQEVVKSTFDPLAPLFSLLVVIVVGTIVYTVRESLDLPVAPKRRWWAKSRKKSGQKSMIQPLQLFRRGEASSPANSATFAANANEDFIRPRRPVRVPDHSELPEWEPPRSDSDLIMLEID